MGAYARALISRRDDEALDLLLEAGLSSQQARKLLAEDKRRDTIASRRRRFAYRLRARGRA